MVLLLWNIFLSLRSGAAGRRRPVGGQHPRVGDDARRHRAYNFDRLPEIRSERPLFDVRHGRTAEH